MGSWHWLCPWLFPLKLNWPNFQHITWPRPLLFAIWHPSVSSVQSAWSKVKTALQLPGQYITTASLLSEGMSWFNLKYSSRGAEINRWRARMVRGVVPMAKNARKEIIWHWYLNLCISSAQRTSVLSVRVPQIWMPGGPAVCSNLVRLIWRWAEVKS